MVKKAIKVIKIVIISVLAVIGLIFAAWALRSSGKIRTYSEPDSLSEKFVIEINGAPNGFFINSKDIKNPVLLLVSSGPGTDDYVFTDKYKDMTLEDEFTVVYWDYRSMGIAYDKSANIEQITLENLLKDTGEVTAYLKERFGKEKIYIMGFSGGSHLALRAAEEHPEDYYALIGMAQVVTDSNDRDTIMYEFMKDEFEARGDKKRVKKLEDSVEKLEDGAVKCNDWYSYVYLLHDAGGGTILNKTEFEGITLPILLSRCYTMKEKINYVRGMKMYRTTPLADDLKDFDYRESITELAIPAYFISGEKDYNCPWPLVEDYCNNLKAPAKEFFMIPKAAHSPLWENPKATLDVFKHIKDEKWND